MTSHPLLFLYQGDSGQVLGLLLALALALAAGIALALLYREHLDTAAVTAWIAAAGLAGPLVFMAIYAVATVFFLPGSPE